MNRELNAFVFNDHTIEFKTSTHMWPIMENICLNNGYIYVSFFFHTGYLCTIKVSGNPLKLSGFDPKIAHEIFVLATERSEIISF